MPADNNLDPFGLRRVAEAAKRGPSHIKFLFLFVGAGIVMSFLALTSLAPQIGDRLGNLAVRKQLQQSYAASGDTDGDGFYDDIEKYIGTNPFQACSDRPSPDNGSSNTWPADLSSGGISYDRIDIQDLSKFISPVRRLNTKEGDINFDKRWDLNADRQITIEDINIINTLKPPMFNGGRAFNGPKCARLSSPTPSPVALPVSNLRAITSCDEENRPRVTFRWQNNVLPTSYRFLDINVNPWINEDQPQPWGTKFQLGDSFVWDKNMPLDRGDVDPRTNGSQLRPAENMTYYWRILAGNETIKYPPVYPTGTYTPAGTPFTTASCSK